MCFYALCCVHAWGGEWPTPLPDVSVAPSAPAPLRLPPLHLPHTMLSLMHSIMQCRQNHHPPRLSNTFCVPLRLCTAGGAD
jgi:hypothetical protein